MAALLDRRQLIINQLYSLLSSLSIPLLGGLNGPITLAAGNIVHNRDQLTAELVPGIILLDADEQVSLLPKVDGAGRQAGPSLMAMTPEIYVVLDVRQPQNLNVSEDVNSARAAILGLILNDPTLLQIVGSNGRIYCKSCVTDLARNRQMLGQLGLEIVFIYPLLPNEIAQAPT